MSWNDHGERIVDETVLLAWYRDRLNNWPTHQYRMRKLLHDTPNVK